MELVVSIHPKDIFSWDSQGKQYPATGEPGISYFRGDVSDTVWVDCLLYRDDDGTLRGVLNHYPVDNDFERAGNFNLFVQPSHYRQGIGTALVTEADLRWDIDFAQQRYTPNGASLVAKYLTESGRA